MNLRDEVLKQGKQLYSESQLVEKMGLVSQTNHLVRVWITRFFSRVREKEAIRK